MAVKASFNRGMSNSDDTTRTIASSMTVKPRWEFRVMCFFIAVSLPRSLSLARRWIAGPGVESQMTRAARG